VKNISLSKETKRFDGKSLYFFNAFQANGVFTWLFSMKWQNLNF